MGFTIDIDELPAPLRAMVQKAMPAIKKRRIQQQMKPDYLMHYREAAELYGYSYSSLRGYVSNGQLQATTDPLGCSRISHAAMKAFLKSKKVHTRRTVADLVELKHQAEALVRDGSPPMTLLHCAQTYGYTRQNLARKVVLGTLRFKQTANGVILIRHQYMVAMFKAQLKRFVKEKK